MKITPSQLTISQLFSSKNEQFSIPAYQRRYGWVDKQIVELFEDINLLDQNDTHFLGTILLLTEPHKADINQLEVVDGQQRIISISLLLKAIRDRLIELKKEDIAVEIESYLFCQGIDRRKQNKIILGDLDEPDYSRILTLKDLDGIKNQKLLNAYNEFRKWISGFSFEKLNALYFKLLNNTIVVRLDAEKAKDAYKLFETINDRGLKLSPTDIIKNFLLGHASMIGEDVLKTIREYWKELIVSLDGIETDDFFRQYLAGTLQRKVTFNKLIFEFKRYYLTTVKEAGILPEYRLFNDFEEYDSGGGNNEIENGEEVKEEKDGNRLLSTREKISITDFSNSIKNAACIYRKIVNRSFENNKINHHLYNLQRIESIPSYTFLLNIFQREISNQDKIDILNLLEGFILRRHICESRTAELDDIFSGIVDVKDEDIVNQVRTKLSKYLPPDQEFQNKFFMYSFKGKESRAKYVLEQFEYNLINDKGEYIISSGRDVHMEHIIPQTIDTKKAKKEYGDWVTYLGKESLIKHSEYVNRIGNLTLLAQKLNITASNNPFLAKKKEYKKSNIQLTKKIAKEYRVFRFREVDKRSREFAVLTPKIWNLY